MKLRNIFLTSALALFSLTACNDNDKPVYPETPIYNMSGFAKGADVSWLTEMEKSGKKFYNASGRETECMTLLRDLGMNAIRLRVWVNPQEGWCNKNDVLIKAYRVHDLGMRLMIDFHYSDSWADPGQQTKPAAWEELRQEELENAVATHTKEVLTTLKDNGITPEWIQVGNETGNGMLWKNGLVKEKGVNENFNGYARLNNAGYDAAKEIFPDAKVIVHLQEGKNNSLFRWLFDGLKANNGKWDVIGMSLYPTPTTWENMNASCLANMNDMISRYGSEVMLCEVGMPWDNAESCKAFLTDLIGKTRNVANNKCLGVFYWEPEAYGGWKSYTRGAFDHNGRPTVALNAFKDK